ncbi:MAG: NUDIX domain-containing protein [Bacteroidales bacterium]|nr:NUDIX domain-containing protein [Bacteroidales bacterium]
MYKVFINNKYVLITNFLNKISRDVNKKTIRHEDIVSLSSEIEKIEKGKTKEDVIIFRSNDINALEKDFFSLYKLIEAAGGIVRNKSGDILFIYRFGRWDLPKGKLEDREKIKDAAIREVKEETGLKEIKILSTLDPTYHTYIEKGERILKKTHWFEMYASGNQELTPQYQEDITNVKWFKKSNLDKALKSTYLSIKNLVTDYYSNLKI